MFEWKNKTDKYIADFILSQQVRMEKRRDIYNDLHELLIKIFRPRRYDILGSSSAGKQFGANVFDQIPANVLNQFVGGLLGYSVSRSNPWIQFITPNARLMNRDSIKSYCQDAAEQILYAANRSTLYSALVPHALDAHSVGTSVMVPMIDDVKDRVVFDVVHPRDSYIAVNKYGEPNIYHRPMKLTAINAVGLFGKKNLPKKLVKNAEGQNPFAEYEFIYAVYPNNDRKDGSLLAEDKPYAVFYASKFGGQRRKYSLVKRTGSDYFPVCWRALPESGAEYGTSLAADCLTSGLVSNKLAEKSIAAAHLVVEPPALVASTLRSELHLNPGGRTYTTDFQREGIKLLMDRLNWPITDAQILRIHDALKDRFFIKFFEMLSAGDIKARTAYEVSQMMGEKATLMGTIVDTLEQESLEPSISILIRAEEEAGRMPDVPDELLMEGGRVDIKYIGPLAQLQRSLLRSKGTIDALALIREVMSMNEQAGWKINWMELIEEICVAQGMPQRLILSDADVGAIIQQQAQAEEAAQQLDQLETVAGAVPKLAERIEPRSPISMLAGPQKELAS